MKKSLTFEKFGEVKGLRDSFAKACLSWVDEHGVPSGGKEFLVGMFFIRAIELFKDSTELAFNGRNTSASILIRSIFECLVQAKACFDSEEALDQYMARHPRSMIAQFNKMKRSDSDFVQGEAKKFNPATLKEFEGELLDPKKSGKWSLQKFAKEAGLEELYTLYYSLGSSDAHVSPSSLDKSVLLNQDNEVCALHVGDSYEESGRNIAVSGFFLAQLFGVFQQASIKKEDGIPLHWIKQWENVLSIYSDGSN
jgi:hypothetical protein